MGKDPDPGKDGTQKEKREVEDEMVGQHHRLNGYEFEQTPRDYGRRKPGMLLRGPKASDVTERLNSRDFPGGPVVKTQSSRAGGLGLIPGWGAKIPHAQWPKNQNINNRSNIVKNLRIFK